MTTVSGCMSVAGFSLDAGLLHVTTVSGCMSVAGFSLDGFPARDNC